MRTMAVSEFKAKALKTLDRVASTHEPLLITRRNKPLATVVPASVPDEKWKPGKLRDTLVFEHDIISPLGESEWHACR